MERYELAAILKDVGNFSMDDFAGRLTLQKTVRLLQALGVDMWYRFARYLHGPYCKALFKDGHEVRRVIDGLPRAEASFEGEETQKRYERSKEFMQDKKRDPSLLEICAPISRLAAAGIGRDDILKVVEDKKPEFSSSQCELMWDEFEKYGAVDDGTA